MGMFRAVKYGVPHKWLGVGHGLRRRSPRGCSSPFDLRLLQIARHESFGPEATRLSASEDGSKCESRQCTQQVLRTSYFYDLRLLEELEVPVGMIDSSWGGTPARGMDVAPGYLKGYSRFRDAHCISRENDEREHRRKRRRRCGCEVVRKRILPNSRRKWRKKLLPMVSSLACRHRSHGNAPYSLATTALWVRKFSMFRLNLPENR